MARPTKQTPEIIGKLEYAFSIGSSIEEACFYGDIHKDTYYDWIKKNPALSDRFEALRQKPIFEARESVIKGMKRDPRLAMDFLSRKKKDEFSTKSENDFTSGGNPLSPILVKFIGEPTNAPADDRNTNGV